MQFIEALKFRSKLFFLFVLITVGLVSVGILGSLNMNAMKKNIDGVYFGSLVPVTELNTILQTYHSSLAYSVYKARELEISPSQVSSEIQSALYNVERIWKDYESHFKRDTELEYVEYVALEISIINNYFKQVSQAAFDGKDMSRISLILLQKHVTHIDKTIQKLINYEVNVARYERVHFINNYEKSLLQLTVALSLIIMGVLLVLLYVFRSIQSDHSLLEKTTSKLRHVNKKLENVSYTDALTSLNNRRYFNLVYKRELLRAKREKSYITFMMLDIDFFKQFNDTYGHIEGDYALKSVAKTLQDTLKRPTDFVFRLGGEEFGVLLTHTDETNSAKLARSICDTIRARKIKHAGSKINEYLTISIGVVCCVADNSLDGDILISKADEMLYEAKETGRDRYMISSDISQSKTINQVEPNIKESA